MEGKDLPKEELRMENNLYRVVLDQVPKSVVTNRNKKKAWAYGYSSDYDFVVISKDGTIGEIYEIGGLKVALPSTPTKVDNFNNVWTPKEYPEELQKIKTIFDWNRRDNVFKSRYIDLVEGEFDKREYGYWFMNNNTPTYVTGSHYMYLQWTKIDVGLPDFRESNRIFYIFWEACKADARSFGMCYLKNRRSGFSFMSSSESCSTGTIVRDSRIGILSKTGSDAKKMFTDKVVPIIRNYPFFFKPIQDGMDNPKTELAFRVPASKITRRNMDDEKTEEIDGLDTTIDWKNTADNSYDGEKLLLLVHDECYAPDTLILTEDWKFKEIKDINIGDKVIVEGGLVKTIKAKTNGVTDTYLIKQPYGNDYVVTENHRLVLNDYNKGEVILTAKEYFNSSKYRKQHITRIASNGIESKDIFNGIPPYLLGLWLGDGRKHSFTILVNKDEEPELLHYLGRISEIKNIPFELKKSTSDKIVEFAFKGINQSLRDIGVYNNKHIPEQYIKSSIDTRLQLLAGLIDSDGHSDKKKGVIEIGMSKKHIVDSIRFIALSCGLSCSNIMHRKSNYNTDVYRIFISGDLAKIPMITKKKSFEDYIPKTRGRRNKVSIEYKGLGDYIGIQVDGENDNERKLILSDFTLSLNSGKWEKPENILNNWRVTKTCLRLGSKIVGKCMMGSTSNALSKGGDNFKKLFNDSNPASRSANGQTKQGLYSLFIPMEWNIEGYIDRYGWPVFEDPKTPVIGMDGEKITNGVISWWTNEVTALKSDADALNEFYRQFPRTESHAFRDESKQSLFNLTKIYQQIDYNDSLIKDRVLTRGYFHWKDGKPDTTVVWTPDQKGRFLVSWIPEQNKRNNVIDRKGLKYPGNENIGSFGCDPYDISGVVGGGGSNGALHGMTKFHMENAPTNEFFLEYIARPQTAEIFFEDVLMACVFYGMPILIENNKQRLLYHFKNRGYRPFSINRPDKHYSKLSKTEIELGGIPNSSEDVKQAHASAIGSYIEEYVGLDLEGTYRDQDSMGSMYFTKTLEDWARFDINNRTKHDASISSGLAIMSTKKYIVNQEKTNTKISIKFARYDNTGNRSEIKK
jgi:hypothetical protein